ncbi:MAG: ABC transporter substrate-binding protein [Candidatus Pacebacteria bacterium]|nr:ABC transporter substrate-binding protein [Candidatus Paceibacterota bacterium]
MNYSKILSSFKFKFLLSELKLRLAAKTLSLQLRALLILFISVFTISGFFLLYQADKALSVTVPSEGGMLREGIIGTPRFINPVLTISDTDRDMTSLIYSGLMRPSESGLIPDLAEKYELSEDGLVYTFTLKPDLKWSDGKKLTTEDILFTIQFIQNPDTKSPKRANWEGVEAEIVDERTVNFRLQKPYSPFLENTTIGILPKHVWENVLPEQMSLSDFNINAVGSGPYKIEKVTKSSSGIIASYLLSANDNFSLKKPFIKKISVKFYPSEKKLIEAYEKNEIDSVSALSPQNMLAMQKAESFLKVYQLPRVFAVFFNQNDAPVFAEKEVREALTLATDKKLIVREVLKEFGNTLDGPIPPGSLGYSPAGANEEQDAQKNKEEAKKLLEKNGWKYNEEEKVWQKEKKKKEILKLEFSISTSDVPDLVQTAQILKNEWESMGAKVNVKIFEIGDLEQNVIRPRKYDTLLFGEILNRDPDLFAFWHSSQRNDPGLNIALYANITADKLLEEARTISDAEKREEKNIKFQKEINKDKPAIFLYSPNFLYLVPSSLGGINSKSITISSERFSGINNWYLETKKVWKILEK